MFKKECRFYSDFSHQLLNIGPWCIKITILHPWNFRIHSNTKFPIGTPFKVNFDRWNWHFSLQIGPKKVYFYIIQRNFSYFQKSYWCFFVICYLALYMRVSLPRIGPLNYVICNLEVISRQYEVQWRPTEGLREPPRASQGHPRTR